MFQLMMVEVDETVGSPDARAVRKYPLDTVDTLSHATQLRNERYESIAARIDDGHREDGKHVFRQLVVNRNHPHEYGNVYRTTHILITVKDK